MWVTDLPCEHKLARPTIRLVADPLEVVNPCNNCVFLLVLEGHVEEVAEEIANAVVCIPTVPSKFDNFVGRGLTYIIYAE